MYSTKQTHPGDTPLHSEARKMNQKGIVLCIQQGHSLFQQNNHGVPPIQQILDALETHIDHSQFFEEIYKASVTYAISNGADEESITHEFIYAAVTSGSVALFDWLIKFKPDSDFNALDTDDHQQCFKSLKLAIERFHAITDSDDQSFGVYLNIIRTLIIYGLRSKPQEAECWAEIRHKIQTLDNCSLACLCNQSGFDVELTKYLRVISSQCRQSKNLSLANFTAVFNALTGRQQIKLIGDESTLVLELINLGITSNQFPEITCLLQLLEDSGLEVLLEFGEAILSRIHKASKSELETFSLTTAEIASYLQEKHFKPHQKTNLMILTQLCIGELVQVGFAN